MAELYRIMDRGRGEFIPTQRDPKNHQGVRHPDKTAQDHLPVSERPRVKDWQRRLEAAKP